MRNQAGLRASAVRHFQKLAEAKVQQYLGHLAERMGAVGEVPADDLGKLRVLQESTAQRHLRA